MSDAPSDVWDDLRAVATEVAAIKGARGAYATLGAALHEIAEARSVSDARTELMRFSFAFALRKRVTKREESTKRAALALLERLRTTKEGDR